MHSLVPRPSSFIPLKPGIYKKGGLVTPSFVSARYDEARIQEVGPDRAAAEWLIRCGASVRWAGAEQFHSDYNTLPVSRALKIQEIDATDSSIMHIGFPYLSMHAGQEHLVEDKA